MDLKQLDRFCMQFEDSWRLDQPHSFPFQFYHSKSPKFGSATEILAEICMIDMQRRWQHWSRKDLSGMKAVDVLEQLSRLPTYEQYSAIAAERGFVFEATDVVELKSSEFSARQKYGDLPAPSEADVDVRLTPAKRVSRPTVSVLKSGQRVYECDIWGKVEVGRQAYGEPEFPVLIEDSTPPKLLCAEGMDASISRNQFTASLVSRRYSIVTNTSANRTFVVNYDQFVLAPRSNGVFAIPFSVNLGDTTVRFE